MGPTRRRGRVDITGQSQYYKHALDMNEMKNLLNSDVKLSAVNLKQEEHVHGPTDAKATVWLIFPNPSEKIGHYITTIKAPKGILIFDPYGKRTGVPHPTTFLPDSIQGPVKLSTHNYEGQPNPEINTCGEWAALRANHCNMSDTQFHNHFSRYTNKAVGAWAFELIENKNEARNNEIAQAESDKNEIEEREPQGAGTGISSEETAVDPENSDPSNKSSFLKN